MSRHLVVVVGAAVLSIALAPPAYAAAGDLDPAFGVGGKVTTDFTRKGDSANSLAIQADGRIVVAGKSGPKFALARYNSDGSLNTSFGGDGKVTTNFTSGEDDAFGVGIQSDGKIVAAGLAGFGVSNPKFALARYNTDGSLDTSFSGDGKLTTDFTRKYDSAYSVAIQADGKIVAAGESGVVLGGSANTKIALVRYIAS